MKKLITLALSIIFTMTAFGQRLEYERSSNWFFGLNAGAAWNTTDVQNKTHAGWGFLLGRSYNYDYGRRISYDLRLRYLRGKWYGQDTDSTNLDFLGADYTGALSDYKDGLGYTVNNFEADVHELGFELAIHFNRFRDRTGWDPYIFGGANIVWNETYGDLVKQDAFLAGDTLYAYDQIAMSNSAIENALDGNYETALDGSSAGRYNVNFMPSLGIGLGYDLGPRFSIGVEHKTTFALRDDFDGYANAEPNWGFLENDVYHYTSAYLTWRFKSRAGRVRPTPQPRPQPNQPVVGGGGSVDPCQLPNVRITRPLQRTENVQASYYVFRAEVSFVQSRSQIEMRINGIETTNFLYNHDTHQLESYLNLQPGNNMIEIIGRNTCGTDSETATIIFDNCIDPIVYFENVCSNTSTAQVEQPNYTVQAQISNATSIQFTVNGVQSTNFSYNNATGRFTSNILLNEGQNTIRIVAISPCGNDTGTSVVTYTNCADPLVNFVNGNNGFLAVSQSNFDLSAYIYNVTNSNSIQLRLNGATRNVSFNSNTRLLTSTLALNPGQNTIQIVATNNCGSDTETLTIEYTPCVDPSIQMILPIVQSTTTANGTQAIKATLFNVANVNQVQLFVNGNLQQGGSFNAITKLYEATVALNSGFNTIQIVAINDCGSDTETISVNYDPCNTPDVQMILPSANGGLVSSPSQLVQAMVFNVNNISEIQTFVNGNLQNGGTFNSVNGLYQNTVGLSLGVNTIQVVATNGCGTDVQTVTVTYRACEAPVITYTAPTGSPFFTNATDYNVSAMVGSITNASQVVLTVNGVVDGSGATYNSSSLTYSNTVSLIGGNNIIVLTATNNCGTVSKEINIVREIVVIDVPTSNIDSIVICVVHSNNVGDPVTMMIPLSQWPTYQSQGAQLGPCPVIDEPIDLPMTICYEVNGTPTTMQILTSEWPAYQALGAIQGACRQETMNICFNGNQLTIPVSQWSSYQSQGATEGPCPVDPVETIVICSNGVEMTILTSEWPGYQAQGAVLGPCPTVDPELVICLEGNQQTILTSQWPTYQAQGATQGPCPVDPEMTICTVVNGVRTTMTILTSEWPTYQAQGAMQGPCPSVVDPLITICHEVNGTPTTMQILTSEWPTYQAQGATQGPCPAADPQITICLKQTEMQILTSQWPTYQAQGATQGPCGGTDPAMTICLGGNEMQILTSEWPTYQAQGATQGPCPAVDPEMVICIPLNGVRTTMTILTSEWPTYQAQGARPGACPTVQPMTICVDVNGVPTTMLIQPSEWASYQAQGATVGECEVDSSIVICVNGEAKTILESEWVLYENQGATRGPCPVVNQELVTICLNGQELKVQATAIGEYLLQGATEGPCPTDPEMKICHVVNGVRTTMMIPTSQWPTYQAQGAMEGPCPSVVDPLISICVIQNGVPTTIQILTSEWSEYQSQGAIMGSCADQTMTICYNGRTLQIQATEWGTYQELGAVIGPCSGSVNGGTNVLNPNGVNSDSLDNNNTIERPTNGLGDEDELLFGDRKITICHTPEGSIASQTMQIPLSQWQDYQLKGATLGACSGKVTPTGGNGSIEVNPNEGTNGNGGDVIPINPKSNGNIPQGENGSQNSSKEALRKQQEEAARRQAEETKRKAEQEAEAAKARQEQAAKDAAAKKVAQEEAARRQAEETKRKAEQEAAAAKARQEQAAKDAAAKKAAQEEAARRQAEETKRKAEQEAAAAKARQEQAAKDAAAKKAAQEEAARRQAEEAKRKAQQEAAAAKARQEQAAKDAAAKKAAQEAAARKAAQEKAAREAEARKRAAQEEAKRKAAQEAAAAKARQEKAAKEAAARKAAQEKAAREAAAKKKAQEEARRKAAAKKAAEEAARKKAEEQRKANEREGGR